MGKVLTTVMKPIKSLFSAPEPPAIEAKDDPVMPVADEEALARARKRTAAGASKRGGRASTVLTMGSGGGKDKLGG